MKQKPISPYARLLADVQKFARGVKYPTSKQMWAYNKTQIRDTWSLESLYERVRAADQIGFDVRLVATDDGLRVEYVERPRIPFGWAP